MYRIHSAILLFLIAQLSAVVERVGISDANRKKLIKLDDSKNCFSNMSHLSTPKRLFIAILNESKEEQCYTFDVNDADDVAELSNFKLTYYYIDNENASTFTHPIAWIPTCLN